MECDVIIRPRPDLSPDWYEITLLSTTGLGLVLQHIVPGGTIIEVENLTLVTIEAGMPGSPVMCQIANTYGERSYPNRKAFDLIEKYRQDSPPSLWRRLWKWIRP